ncbi:cation:proton antiporter [Natranaeroarchaeum sulfidigenes]|uniref:Kef-type K+ transport system, membrane componentfused TrkA K+ transport system n=1 Tax=Natranaeroarchaeum sulfidigenes TaxID=2784880 RepID=A0A897MQU6_9EURY|nr:cation:proton antiporter [Natranaeroarchaeum sulfidigenes]QSG01373.1 Kef-type K+ transport system, membrane componentfused TrkA K+ transport system [Natranaeroarchaeum sulfidigenes]
MTDLVISLAAVFITAGVLLIVANHFGLPPAPFYILAGLIVGLVVEPADVVELAQWGIAFLVFVFGIQVDFNDLQSVLRDGEVAAATQLIVVAPVAFGVGLAFGELFGFAEPVRNALYFAAAATLSSTIVGGGLLKAQIRDNLAHGRLASSIHFFDDLVAIMAVLILSADQLTDVQLVTSNIGIGVLLILAALVIYRHGFPLLVRLADGVDELVLMGSISIMIAFVAIAEMANISIVVGAFAAGIAIRNDGTQALPVQNGIDSIRDFFVAIFFVTVGALVSIPSVEVLALAVVLVGLVMIVNPIVLMLAFAYEGYDARTSFLASSSLGQVSEFSLIIAIQAWIMGTIADSMFDAVILAAAITMILSSIKRQYEESIYETVIKRMFGDRQTRKIDERSQVADDIENHTIVVGYGRQGRRVVETLERLDRPYVVVENDPSLWNDLRSECRNYVLGDARADYTWQRARLDTVTSVVSTVDHAPVSQTLLALDTDADLILRADSTAEAEQLLEDGALYVVVPDMLAAGQLVEIIDRLLSGEVTPDELSEEHLDRLATLERYGFASRADRL